MVQLHQSERQLRKSYFTEDIRIPSACNIQCKSARAYGDLQSLNPEANTRLSLRIGQRGQVSVHERNMKERQSRGRTRQSIKLMKEFYDNKFNKVVDGKPNLTKLSQVKNYYVTSMITAFKNNITSHFINRFNKYINKQFKDEAKKELRAIKNDILTKPLKKNIKSNIKHYKWIKDNRYKLLHDVSVGERGLTRKNKFF